MHLRKIIARQSRRRRVEIGARNAARYSMHIFEFLSPLESRVRYFPAYIFIRRTDQFLSCFKSGTSHGAANYFPAIVLCPSLNFSRDILLVSITTTFVSRPLRLSNLPLLAIQFRGGQHFLRIIPRPCLMYSALVFNHRTAYN